MSPRSSAADPWDSHFSNGLFLFSSQVCMALEIRLLMWIVLPAQYLLLWLKFGRSIIVRLRKVTYKMYKVLPNIRGYISRTPVSKSQLGAIWKAIRHRCTIKFRWKIWPCENFKCFEDSRKEKKKYINLKAPMFSNLNSTEPCPPVVQLLTQPTSIISRIQH